MVYHVLWYFIGMGCNEHWPHIIVQFIDIFLMSCGVFMHRLGGETYPIWFHPWWQIVLFFKWYLVWGCGYCWFCLTSYLRCQGCWYGHWLRIQHWRWLVPIFLLLHYFGLSFSCLNFYSSVVFPCKMSVNFLSASSYSVPKVKNGVAGAVFFCAVIKSVRTQ